MQVKRTDEDWDKLLGEYMADCETVAVFCRRHSISVSSFYAWKAKLGCRPAKPAKSVNMLPVIVSDEPKSRDEAVELVLRHGMAIRFAPGVSVRFVAEMVRALA